MIIIPLLYWMEMLLNAAWLCLKGLLLQWKKHMEMEKVFLYCLTKQISGLEKKESCLLINCQTLCGRFDLWLVYLDLEKSYNACTFTELQRKKMQRSHKHDMRHAEDELAKVGGRFIALVSSICYWQKGEGTQSRTSVRMLCSFSSRYLTCESSFFSFHWRTNPNVKQSTVLYHSCRSM